MRKKICDMRTLLKYAKYVAIAYSHKIDVPNWQLLYCSLAVYLLLFSASYYLHRPGTTFGARNLQERLGACVLIQMSS